MLAPLKNIACNSEFNGDLYKLLRFQAANFVQRKELFAALSENLGAVREDTYAYYTGLEDGQIKTYKKTAEKFGIPIGTVKSRINTARKELKKVILKKLKT